LKKLFTAALAVLVATSAFSQVDPNRVVAVVNGEEIKGGEYYHRMEYLPGVGKVTGQSFSEFPPGFLTVEQLITERLVFQLAKKKGALPSDLEVAAEYKRRTEDNPSLEQVWLSSGRSLDEMKYQIRYELAQFNIQTAGITVTNQEVDSYFTKHPDEFTIPKKYRLRVVVVKTDADKQAVETALSGGTSFADVAKQYSVDVTAKTTGGEYGSIPETSLAGPLLDAIKSTQIGKTTTWISTTTGGEPSSVKFLIEDILPPKKVAMSESLRAKIRSKMMLDQGKAKNDITKEMKAMRGSATIDIKQAEFKEAYEKFIQAYLKQTG